MGKKSNLTSWAIVAIIALLGLNGYQWYNNSQLKANNLKHEREVVELQKVQADLDQAYQESLESLEDMRTDNKDLNNLIESQKRELLAQKDKINGLIWTKRELSKAREEIQILHNQAATYVAEISKLKQENTQLSARNTKLASENSVLSQQIVAEIEDKKKIVEEKQNIEAAKELLSSDNKKLSKKVDMANAIKINFIEVQGYRLKSNGKRRKRRRAKNINLLEVCFKTETNMVTSAGEKEFFVRIEDPLGETLTLDGGSGVLENKLDNTQVRYTTSGTMEYNNEDTSGCLNFEIFNKLQKGVYKLTMYNNGFPVGKGEFKLK